MHWLGDNSTEPPHFFDVGHITAVCEEYNSSCMAFYIVRVMVVVCWPFSVVVGLIMNTMSLVIFVRLTLRTSRSKRRHAFMAALACADLFAVPVGIAVLVGVIGNWWLKLPNMSLLDIDGHTCRLSYFMYGICSLSSTNMFVCVTWDRLLTVRYPLFMRRCSLRPALIIIAVSFLFSLFSASIVLVDVGFMESNFTTACVILRRPFMWGIFSLLIRRGALIQLTLIIVGNAVLVSEIVKFRRNHLMLTTHTLTSSQNSLSSGQRRKKNSQVVAFSRSVAQLWLALIYCLCSFPWVVALMLMHLLRFQGSHHREMVYGLWYVGLFSVFCFQGSSNWVIYMWRMPDYRKEMCHICSCRNLPPCLFRKRTGDVNGGKQSPTLSRYYGSSGGTQNSVTTTNRVERPSHRIRQFYVLHHLVMRRPIASYT